MNVNIYIVTTRVSRKTCAVKLMLPGSVFVKYKDKQTYNSLFILGVILFFYLLPPAAAVCIIFNNYLEEVPLNKS